MDQRLSRRQFCALTGAGLVALQLPGCGGGEAPLPDGGAADLASPPHNGGPSPADGGPSARDLGTAPRGDLADACGPAGSIDGGPAAQLVVGQAQSVTGKHLFVCRDAGGLYALTSICTHMGCDVGFVSASDGFHCPCHGSTYDFNGQVTNGPAPLPLSHFALCVDSAGEIFVDPQTVVPADQRT